MRGVSPWQVAWAFLRRDAAEAASSRLRFLVYALGLGSLLLTFASLARFVGNPVGQGGAAEALAPTGAAGILGFWLVGLAVGELFRRTATGLARKVREAQLEGTLEAILGTPAPAAWIVLSTPLYEILAGAVEAILLVGAGAAFFAVPLRPDAGGLAAATVLSLLAFGSLGLLGGALTMSLRRTDPVTALLGVAGVLVGGVLFPVTELPGVLRVAASAFPLAPSLDAFRLSLFAGAGAGALTAPLVALAAFTAVCGPAAALLFAWALRRARVQGSLGQY
ncbi:MAG TPA: ABC transporter permease [Haliangiales bacterium]|nr:ABC transporter permease [Haliangiales bacterium]